MARDGVENIKAFLQIYIKALEGNACVLGN